MNKLEKATTEDTRLPFICKKPFGRDSGREGKYGVVSVDDIGHVILVGLDKKQFAARIDRDDVSKFKTMAIIGLDTVYVNVDSRGLGYVYESEFDDRFGNY